MSGRRFLVLDGLLVLGLARAEVEAEVRSGTHTRGGLIAAAAAHDGGGGGGGDDGGPRCGVRETVPCAAAPSVRTGFRNRVKLPLDVGLEAFA